MAERKRKTKAPRAKAAPAAKAAATPKPAAPTQGSEVCPRCGTSKFASEERTRFEGRRVVRTTVLVCERGHTFAKPAVARPKT